MKEACEKIMVEIIEAKNAVTYLLLAEKCSFPVLCHVAINVIVENYKEVQNYTTDGAKSDEKKQVNESGGESEAENAKTDWQPFGGIIGSDLMKEIFDVMSTKRLDQIDWV